MDKKGILQLVNDLKTVLEEPRHGQVRAAPGVVAAVIISPTTIAANEDESSLRRSLELAGEILIHCPASRGVHDYLLEVVDDHCRLGMSAADILSYFGVLQDDWSLFDRDGIEATEHKMLLADSLALFYVLLYHLGIVLPERQINQLTAVQVSEYFAGAVASPHGGWLAADQLPPMQSPVLELWEARFAQGRRILAWAKSYEQWYGHPPADFAEIQRRIQKFLEYAPA